MYVTLYEFELLLLIRVNWLSSMPGSKSLLHRNCTFVDLLFECRHSLTVCVPDFPDFMSSFLKP